MIDSAPLGAGLGTLLGIWAHPDDEAYLSGGLMAMARDDGARVVCVTATRGELGTTDPQTWPPERLAAERTREPARCLEILGVSEHRWLGYRDSECAVVPAADAVARLSGSIDEVRPDTVLTFGPDGITGHPDHRRDLGMGHRGVRPCGRARCATAVRDDPRPDVPRWRELDERLGVYLPGYPVTTAEEGLAVDLVLAPDVAARKVRALAAQVTQTAPLITAMGVDRYTAWVGDEAFLRRGAPAR